jgi:hypothetical protein
MLFEYRTSEIIAAIVEACFCKDFAENVSPLLICNKLQLWEGNFGIEALTMKENVVESENCSFLVRAARSSDAKLHNVFT